MTITEPIQGKEANITREKKGPTTDQTWLLLTFKEWWESNFFFSFLLSLHVKWKKMIKVEKTRQTFTIEWFFSQIVHWNTIKNVNFNKQKINFSDKTFQL